MDDLTFVAIKEAELKQKQELIDFVTEKLDAAVAHEILPLPDGMAKPYPEFPKTKKR